MSNEMVTEVVGPFTIRALTVEEGLDLMGISTKDGAGELQTQLILRAVTKDGERIKDNAFSELMPHFAEVVSVVMRLNGFSTKSE